MLYIISSKKPTPILQEQSKAPVYPPFLMIEICALLPNRYYKNSAKLLLKTTNS